MREAAVVGGVLGFGCVVVFALAAAAAMLFPNGALVSTNPWGAKGGVFMDTLPVPAPGPAVLEVPADGAEK